MICAANNDHIVPRKCSPASLKNNALIKRLIIVALAASMQILNFQNATPI